MASIRQRRVKRKAGKDGRIISNGIVYDVYYSYKDSRTGTTKRTSRKGFLNITEARAFITQVEYEKNTGAYRHDTSVTLADYMLEWLELVKPTIRITTYDGYRNNVVKHINPFFKKKKLSELTINNVQALYNSLGEKGKGMKANSIKYTHRVLSLGLDTAVRQGLIQQNVAKFTKLPKSEKFEAETYSLDEVFGLLNKLKDTDMEVMIALSAFMGLRRGEVLGLRWNDIQYDSEGVIVHIRNQVVPCSKGVEMKAPKSNKSKRSLPAPEIIVDILKRHRVRQNTRRLSQANEYKDLDLVNCQENGNVLSPSTFDKRFTKVIKENGPRHIRFHDLRHSYATIMLGLSTNNKIVSELLGHSDASFTQNQYMHVVGKMKHNAAKTLDEAIKKRMGQVK